MREKGEEGRVLGNQKETQTHVICSLLGPGLVDLAFGKRQSVAFDLNQPSDLREQQEPGKNAPTGKAQRQTRLGMLTNGYVKIYIYRYIYISVYIATGGEDETRGYLALDTDAIERKRKDNCMLDGAIRS